jgi:hypothetical protein
MCAVTVAIISQTIIIYKVGPNRDAVGAAAVPGRKLLV